MLLHAQHADLDMGQSNCFLSEMHTATYASIPLGCVLSSPLLLRLIKKILVAVIYLIYSAKLVCSKTIFSLPVWLSFSLLPAPSALSLVPACLFIVPSLFRLPL